MDNESTSQKRIKKQKELFIEQLKKTPIIQIACEKIGIGRSTLYRWKGEDLNFSNQIDEAIIEGTSLVNDMAESVIISGIRDKKLAAAKCWLEYNHYRYARRKDTVLTNDHTTGMTLVDILKKELKTSQDENKDKSD